MLGQYVTVFCFLIFTVRLPDAPGKLIAMLQVVSDSGANILMIDHDRLSNVLGPSEILVHVACEVGGEEHGRSVIASLSNCGYSVTTEQQ